MMIKADRFAGFVKADLKESKGELNNPGRGWYRIYTLKAQPSKEKIPLENEIWFTEEAKRERLALALIDLSAYKDGDISGKALERIDDIFAYFLKSGKQIIPRFVYDTEGDCLKKEPRSIDIIKRHIEQEGEIIARHCDNILVVQGLNLGNWGEMHGSEFCGDDRLIELTNYLYECTEGKCFIALRTPKMIRTVFESVVTAPEVKARLALFNDAMFASPTDLGTYGDPSEPSFTDAKKLSRADELKWQNKTLASSPNGGEAAADERPASFIEAAQEMRLSHITYLNSVYHPIQLTYWKEEKYNGGFNKPISGYDYIGRRLGYRFAVRDAFIGINKELNIKIENSGFADLCMEAECFIEFAGGGASIKRKIQADPKTWRTGKTEVIHTGVFFKKKPKKSDLLISLKLKGNGFPIVFANDGAGDKLKIGAFTGD